MEKEKELEEKKSGDFHKFERGQWSVSGDWELLPEQTHTLCSQCAGLCQTTRRDFETAEVYIR